MISGFCFVAPALPSTSTSSKTNKRSNNNNNRKDDGKKDSFIWRASLGQQLQRLYMRALLQNENAGVNYIRKSLQKRRDEVALGKLQVYADAGQQVQQVSCLLCANQLLSVSCHAKQVYWSNPPINADICLNIQLWEIAVRSWCYAALSLTWCLVLTL